MPRNIHYMNVVTSGPLIIVRTPYPIPRWRCVLKALTAVMRSHGMTRTNVSLVEGMLPYPDEPWSRDDMQFAVRLDAAFAGDPESVSKFWLYDLSPTGHFVLVRKPKGQ
jgi:hypothetical protein